MEASDSERIEINEISKLYKSHKSIVYINHNCFASAFQNITKKMSEIEFLIQFILNATQFSLISAASTHISKSKPTKISYNSVHYGNTFIQHQKFKIKRIESTNSEVEQKRFNHEAFHNSRLEPF